MTTSTLLSTLIALAIAPSILAQQQTVKYDLYELANGGKLQVTNRELTRVIDNDKKAIRLSKREGEGVALLNEVGFSNGTIELDIKGEDVLQQSFVGVAFHSVDERTLDVVYFRPFNFRTTDSVRHIHAVQYVSHPTFTWDKLRSEQNGKYEKAISPAPDPNEWFHARIVVDFPFVRVYVNNNQTPSLEVQLLNDRKDGRIGLWVGTNSRGEFANLSVTRK
jgi:hypothetical protein